MFIPPIKVCNQSFWCRYLGVDEIVCVFYTHVMGTPKEKGKERKYERVILQVMMLSEM